MSRKIRILERNGWTYRRPRAEREDAETTMVGYNEVVEVPDHVYAGLCQKRDEVQRKRAKNQSYRARWIKFEDVPDFSAIDRKVFGREGAFVPIVRERVPLLGQMLSVNAGVAEE